MEKPEYKFRVACFGAGFVGLPTSSVLALHNPDIEVLMKSTKVYCLRYQQGKDQGLLGRENAYFLTWTLRNCC